MGLASMVEHNAQKKATPYADGGVLLGVSLMSTQYFSKARIRAFAHWALSQFDRFLVVVADAAEVTNCRHLRGLSLSDAQRRVARRSRELVCGYTRALAPFGSARVICTSTLVERPHFETVRAVLSEEYASDEAFARRIHAAVVENIGNSLQDTGLSDSALPTLGEYVLHELATTVYLKWFHNPRYSAQVSPKPDPLMCGVLGGHITNTIERLSLHAEPYQYFCETVSVE